MIIIIIITHIALYNVNFFISSQCCTLSTSTIKLKNHKYCKCITSTLKHLLFCNSTADSTLQTVATILVVVIISLVDLGALEFTYV